MQATKMQERRGSGLARWAGILGVGALALWGAYRVLNERYAPYDPDLALTRGHLLTSRCRSALVVASEPGELEHYAGGTIRILTELASTVRPVLVTDGEQHVRRRNGAEIRRREAEAAAASLEMKTPIYLDFSPDRLWHIEDRLRLVQLISELIREYNPGVVIAPVSGAKRRHSNMWVVGQVVVEAVRELGRESLQVYGYGQLPGDVLVDITGYENQKATALKAHRSQLVAQGLPPAVTVRAMGALSRGRTPTKSVESFYRLW